MDPYQLVFRQFTDRKVANIFKDVLWNDVCFGCDIADCCCTRCWQHKFHGVFIHFFDRDRLVVDQSESALPFSLTFCSYVKTTSSAVKSSPSDHLTSCFKCTVNESRLPPVPLIPLTFSSFHLLPL